MDSVFFMNITRVRFGSSQTVVVEGNDLQGRGVSAVIPSTSLTAVVPELAAASAVFLLEPLYRLPKDGDPIPARFVPITDGNAFPTTDAKYVGLTLYSSAGPLQFHIPAAVATKIGSQLLQLGAAPDTTSSRPN